MPPSNFTARVAAVFLLMPLGLAIAACERSESQTKAAPPPPTVTVARPVTKTVVDQDEYVGRFVAVDTLEVRARVSGYLEKIHFQDGQLINKGDLLFTVDRRPFQNAADQARASLAQAKANLAFAEADLARGQNLLGGNIISQQTFEQRTQAKRVAQANVSAQEAAVRQAELDLEFTELRAPVSGRIGDRRVSPGNLVTGGTTGTTTLLATIQSIDPIRFEFTMDETSYLRYLRTAKTGSDWDSLVQGDPRASLEAGGLLEQARRLHDEISVVQRNARSVANQLDPVIGRGKTERVGEADCLE